MTCDRVYVHYESPPYALDVSTFAEHSANVVEEIQESI